MKKSKKLILAVAWYKPEQWIRLRKISADAAELERTYGEWQINAETAVKKLAARGVRVKKIVVDINDLSAWCNERDLPVNGENRSRYAAWLSNKENKG